VTKFALWALVRIAPELRPRTAATNIAASITIVVDGRLTPSLAGQGPHCLDGPSDRIDITECGQRRVVCGYVTAFRQRLGSGQYGGEALRIGSRERHEQPDRPISTG
jgi:hypothetical protein